MTSRYCTAHPHRGSSRAWRLVLACHSLDRQAGQLVIDEHRDCPACLEATVEALADCAHSLMIRSWGIPFMDSAGNCTGQGIDWLLGLIDDHLECEAADAAG